MSLASFSPVLTIQASSRQAPRDGLLSIQYLRAAAALMVVLYHVKPRLLRMGWEGAWPEWLACGVDIFFVISGAIMWITTCERAMSPQEFLVRRFLRIAPLYYLVTGLVVVLAALAPSLAGGKIDAAYIAASFAFLPAPHPVSGEFAPVLPQGWTLNYEMEFYLLFAASLCAPRNLRPGLVTLALAAIVFAGRGAPQASVAGFYSSSIVLEFGLGVLVGMAVTSGLRVQKATAVILLVLGAVGIPATWPFVEAGVPRLWCSGIAAASLVAGAMFLEAGGAAFRSRLMHLLGDASYSIYLTHGLAMSAIAAVWMRAGLAGHPVTLAIFVPVAAVGATLAGIVVYRIAEKPLHDFSRNLWCGRTAPT